MSTHKYYVIFSHTVLSFLNLWTRFLTRHSKDFLWQHEISSRPSFNTGLKNLCNLLLLGLLEKKCISISKLFYFIFWYTNNKQKLYVFMKVVKFHQKTFSYALIIILCCSVYGEFVCDISITLTGHLYSIQNVWKGLRCSTLRNATV